MKLEEILGQLNISAQCKKHGLSLWQCPQFLFLIMGIIIVATSIIVYWIGTKYIGDPYLVSLIILGVSAILFVIDFTISHSFEKLAEINKIKSEFISIVSHQLRTPISNLNWVLELLMSGSLGKIEAKQIEYFKILKENIDRMAELVRDLLIVSRIEAETLFLKEKRFSLSDVIKELIVAFEPVAKASNVTISFENQKDLPQIMADPFQTRQVIENLLDNAIRYIKEKGKVKLKLKLEHDNFYFEINDTGVGIPQKDKKHIFQKFFRADNAMKYQTQGSGLGLYIAKSIIKKSKGKIGFKSQEGQGSTFWFTLPILK
jgi:signal transduction histidine kinase